MKKGDLGNGKEEARFGKAKRIRQNWGEEKKKGLSRGKRGAKMAGRKMDRRIEGAF
jgi:hypothetical protein